MYKNCKMLDQKFKLENINGSKEIIERFRSELDKDSLKDLNRLEMELFVTIGSYPTKISVKKK